MEMSDCKVYRDEFEETRASASLSREAGAHLQACRACLKYYEELSSLKRLVGGLERVSAPTDFESRLQARMHATAHGRGRARASRSTPRSSIFPFNFAPGAVAFTLAAVFMVSVAASLYLKRGTVAPITQGERPPAAATENAPEAISQMIIDPNDDTTGTVTGNLPQQKEGQKGSAASLYAHKGGNAARVVRVTASSNASQRDNEASANFAVRSAGVLEVEKPGAEAASNGRALLAVPLPKSSELMRVVVRDERGAARFISMKHVSFGAQELVGDGLTTQSPSTDKEGVW